MWEYVFYIIVGGQKKFRAHQQLGTSRGPKLIPTWIAFWTSQTSFFCTWCKQFVKTIHSNVKRLLFYYYSSHFRNYEKKYTDKMIKFMNTELDLLLQHKLHCIAHAYLHKTCASHAYIVFTTQWPSHSLLIIIILHSIKWIVTCDNAY